MPNIILIDISASISKQKKMATVSAGADFPVAILNCNQPTFYYVPAELYEKMIEALDDQEPASLVSERIDQPLYDLDLNSYL